MPVSTAVPQIVSRSGAKNFVEGDGMDTVALIGYARSGELMKPMKIGSWAEFCRWFGEDENGYLTALATERSLTAKQILTEKRSFGGTWEGYIHSLFSQGKLDAVNHPTTLSELQRRYAIETENPYIEGTYLAAAVQGFFENGGKSASIIRIARAEDIQAICFSPTPAVFEIPSVAVGAMSFKLREARRDADTLSVEVLHIGERGFMLIVSVGEEQEVHGSETRPLTMATVQERLHSSQMVSLEMTEPKRARRPQAKIYGMGGRMNLLFTAETDPTDDLPKPHDFVGNPDEQSGFYSLLQVENLAMVCAPDLFAPIREHLDYFHKVEEQRELVSLCFRLGNCVALLDAPKDSRPNFLRETVELSDFEAMHGHAALYYPWVQIGRAGDAKETLFIPASGHIAGAWMQAAAERGHLATPTNMPLSGIVGLERECTTADRELLSVVGVNTLRNFGASGIRVWGVRTLSTELMEVWRYLPLRRYVFALEKQLEKKLLSYVFEPQDEELWAMVRLNVGAILYEEWQSNRLKGATPKNAYFVRCDASLNPPERISEGWLSVEIGIALLRDSEFFTLQFEVSPDGCYITE